MSKKTNLNIRLIVLILFFTTVVEAIGGTYVFLPGQSTVIEDGGFANIHEIYTIEGQFQLTIDFDANTASFDHVDANLSESVAGSYGQSLDDLFDMTDLVGIVVSDTEIEFDTADPMDGGKVVHLDLTFAGNSTHLTGGFCESWLQGFCYTLDAVAVAVAGCVYYVDAVNGNDDNDGLTPETAFASIQVGIDATTDGDTVIVADGTYVRRGNTNLDFAGRAITVRSKNGHELTIIDCQNDGRGFYFHSGEGTNSVLDGFTITNGYTDVPGGVIYCDGSSPTITNCIIKDNRANSDGGGMYNGGSSPTVTGCTFSNNSADGWGGGGMANRGGSNPTITNCMFSGNTATGRYGSGGGIVNYCGTNTTLINCVFRGNSATGEEGAGGGMANWGSRTTLTNCTFVGNWALYGKALLNVAVCPGGSPGEVESTNTIFWDGGEEIYEYIPSSTITVTHSDVQGSWPGAGNIDTDPCFADADANDFHLKSQAGRWNPTTENWVIDVVTSPCIDAGDMSSPISYEPFPNGGRINMGAYGGTERASKSYFGTPPCETIVAGDINGDCKVNFLDFAIMAGHWLWEE